LWYFRKSPRQEVDTVALKKVLKKTMKKEPVAKTASPKKGIKEDDEENKP